MREEFLIYSDICQIDDLLDGVHRDVEQAGQAPNPLHLASLKKHRSLLLAELDAEAESDRKPLAA
jgi:hypothetical protein